MPQFHKPLQSRPESDVVVKRLAIAAVLYPVFNAVCLALITSGIVHPPWQLLDMLTVLPLGLSTIGFGVMFSAGERRPRFWAGLGFSGLMLLASAFNRHLSFLAAAAV